MALALAVILNSPPAPAQELRLAADQIKAGLLYSFLRYTDWPQSASSAAPLTICLVGGDAFNGSLSPLAGRSVNARQIALRVVPTSDDLSTCSLIYLGARLRAPWSRIRSVLTGRPVLTVSDAPGFCTTGGMIEFVETDDRIRIRINSAAIASAGLSVEDRLIQLADSSGAGTCV